MALQVLFHTEAQVVSVLEEAGAEAVEHMLPLVHLYLYMEEMEETADLMEIRCQMAHQAVIVISIHCNLGNKIDYHR
jgi:hypothetical protein